MKAQVGREGATIFGFFSWEEVAKNGEWAAFAYGITKLESEANLPVNTSQVTSS